MIVIEASTASAPSSTEETGPKSTDPLHRAQLTRFLNRARKAVKIDGDVTVLIANDQRLKDLNRSFRGKNKATDVLSFPAYENVENEAGDLAISIDTAARQAAQFGHSLEDELRILMLHGLLHLAGQDHETDNGEMAAQEAELRTKLGLVHSLIQRASEPKKNAPVKAIGVRPRSPKKTTIAAIRSRKPVRA